MSTRNAELVFHLLTEDKNDLPPENQGCLVAWRDKPASGYVSDSSIFWDISYWGMVDEIGNVYRGWWKFPLWGAYEVIAWAELPNHWADEIRI